MNVRAKFNFHKQALRQSLIFLSKGRFSTLMTIVVLVMTLVLSALSWILTDNIDKIMTNWKRSEHISLYLDKSVSAQEQSSLLARIQATPGVGEADLKSPEQGLATLQMQEGMQDVMQYLSENPLPAVIDIVPASTIDSVEKIQVLFQTLQNYPHIEQAKLDMEWVNRLFGFFIFITKLAQTLVVFLLLSVVLIIGNTLRLIIQEYQQEIEILQLVGAGDAYIMRPFLYLGIWYGLIAASIATLCVHLFIYSLGTHVNKLFSIYELSFTLSSLSFFQTSLLISCSIFMGWISARLSVIQRVKQLKC